jgi:peptidoglycan/LPS O-acetylase OafA/YrhL
MSLSTNSQYRADIDGLRALAVLSVLLFHAFPNWLKGGFVGVDIFFVISGYLISGIIFTQLDSKSFSFLRFYARRARRIFPALIIVLVSCLVYGWYQLIPSEYEKLGKHAAGGAAFISNIILSRDVGYFDTLSESKPLLHLWSLGIEEQFYIFWPVLIFLFYQKAKYFFVTVFAIFLVSFVINITYIKENPTAVFYLPQYRVWELMIGAMLAFIHARKNLPTYANNKYERFNFIRPNTRALIGFLLLVVPIEIISTDKEFPGWWALLPTLGTFLVLSNDQGGLINRNILSSRWLIFIGKISYPLYLWHWPLLTFVRVRNNFEQITFAETISTLVLSFILAILTYLFVEKPIRFSKVNLINIKYVVVTMFVVFVLGILLALKNGIPERYPESVRDIASYKFMYSDYRRGECLLNENQDFNDFATSCLEHIKSERKLVFLWGDSHAASMYPGLSKISNEASSKYRLAQYTSSGCPPFLDYSSSGRMNCKKNNDYILNKIREVKPHVVILSGYWSSHNGSKDSSIKAKDRLIETIGALKLAGVKKIIVIGQLPSWKLDVPKIILKAWHASGNVPSMTSSFLDVSSKKVDESIKTLSAIDGVEVLSPIDALCNESGCRVTIIENNKLQPIQWDFTHLSSAGSRWLFKYYRERLVNL